MYEYVKEYNEKKYVYGIHQFDDYAATLNLESTPSVLNIVHLNFVLSRIYIPLLARIHIHLSGTIIRGTLTRD